MSTYNQEQGDIVRIQVEEPVVETPAEPTIEVSVEPVIE